MAVKEFQVSEVSDDLLKEMKYEVSIMSGVHCDGLCFTLVAPPEHRAVHRRVPRATQRGYGDGMVRKRAPWQITFTTSPNR